MPSLPVLRQCTFQSHVLVFLGRPTILCLFEKIVNEVLGSVVVSDLATVFLMVEILLVFDVGSVLVQIELAGEANES